MLRTNCSLDFPRLLDVLRAADAWTTGATRLRARSIAVPKRDGGWQNYGTVLRAIEPPARKETPFVVELGPVRLTSRTIGIDALGESDHLLQLLASWRTLLNASSGFAFKIRGPVAHLPSGNEWSSDPCWVVQLDEQSADTPGDNVPSGPFFSPASPVFAEDLEELSKQWLGASFGSSVQHRYSVVLPDRRATFARLSVADAQSLIVDIEQRTQEEIHCMAVGRDRAGLQHRASGEVSSGRCTLTMVSNLHSVDLWLVGPDQDWRDHYQERPGRSSTGPLFLTGLGDSRDPVFRDLRSALESGEGESVEFKEWIQASHRDGKTNELLKTACAFANRSGGAVWIGIDKEGVVTGVRKPLEREYSAAVRGDLAALKAAYQRDVTALLNEGLDPPLAFQCDWVSFARHDVLRVLVPIPARRGYSLAASGDAYRRHGSTNRRLRPADVIDWMDPRNPA